jgi:voltage-gated potassium channel
MSSHPEHDPSEHRIDGVQITSLVLSIYVLLSLSVQTLVPLSDETVDLLNDIDFVVCLFFLYDFIVRFRAAKSKLEFMRWGWIDLISSIPVLPFAGWARMVRVIRILRILRALRSTKILVQYFYQNRAKSALTSAFIIGVVLTIFSAIAVLNFENAPNSNIKTAGDALWWAAATVTTVGPADVYPVTAEGRTVAVMLMTAGVILFAILTGYIASMFNSVGQKKEESEILVLTQEIRLLRQKIEDMESKDANFRRASVAEDGKSPASSDGVLPGFSSNAN